MKLKLLCRAFWHVTGDYFYMIGVMIGFCIVVPAVIYFIGKFTHGLGWRLPSESAGQCSPEIASFIQGMAVFAGICVLILIGIWIYSGFQKLKKAVFKVYDYLEKNEMGEKE